MTTSITLHAYLNTILSPPTEKTAQKKLRIWGENVGRTRKILSCKIPQKPATYKDFRGGGYRIATMISSQPRYDHFDTAAYSFFKPFRSYCPMIPRYFRSCKEFFSQICRFLLDSTALSCYHFKADNSRRALCRCSTMARAPAFQAGDAGSIPVTCSIHLRQ